MLAGRMFHDEVLLTFVKHCSRLTALSLSSRDRLTFSKSILRRFIRDCVDRAPAVASPWTVKPAIAERYGVDTVMPEETRRGVESIKKGEIDKRKKVWEDKEGPATKKQKKMTAAAEEKGMFDVCNRQRYKLKICHSESPRCRC